MEASAVTLALKSGNGADILTPVTHANLVSYEKENSTAKTVQEALDEINTNFQGEKPGITSRVEALESSGLGTTQPDNHYTLPAGSTWVCPTDGLLILSATYKGSYAYATIYAEDGITKLGRLCSYNNNPNGYARICWLFCPKGTKILLNSKSGIAYPYFYPLTGDKL